MGPGIQSPSYQQPSTPISMATGQPMYPHVTQHGVIPQSAPNKGLLECTFSFFAVHSALPFSSSRDVQTHIQRPRWNSAGTIPIGTQ